MRRIAEPRRRERGGSRTRLRELLVPVPSSDGALLERVTPTQSVEAAEIPVRRDPLASGFDRHCRKVCVRHDVSSRADFRAQAAKEIPVARARLHAQAVRRIAKLIGKYERVGERAWFLEDLGVSHDADEPAQHELGNSVCLVTIDHALQPVTVGGVIRRVLPVRIDEDVDVGEDQLTTP